LQAKIDALAESGGGIVRVEPGVHETDALRLRSGITLHLDKGATLLAKKDVEKDYRATQGHAFILADGVDNVAITGEGVIDGRGRDFAPGSLDVFQQPRLIWFRDCRNVRVEGVTLRNGRRWTCYFERCDGVKSRRVKIRSTFHRCCDGFDLECKNALIEDCDIETQDDGICVKSRCSGYSVENIEVRNCRVASNCAHIKIGSETLGVIRNIDIHDIRCETAAESRYAVDPLDKEDFEKRFGFPEPPYAYAGISLQMLDGGILENVKVRNVDIGATSLVPLLMRLSRRKARVLPGASVFRNVLVENVKAQSLSWIGSSVIGSGGLRPSGITFRNVELSVLAGGVPRKPLAEIDSLDGLIIRHDDLMPASGLYLRHADGVTLENVKLRKIGMGERPLFAVDDCDGLKLIGDNDLE
jgi:hypothetical protein